MKNSKTSTHGRAAEPSPVCIHPEGPIGPFTQAPRIDGKLDAGEWDQARGFVRLGPWNGVGSEPRSAFARLGWSPERLYLLVVSEIWPGFTFGEKLDRDDPTLAHTNPTVECWIDPNRANRENGTGDQAYYQVLIDSAGNILDARIDEHHQPDDRWNGNWEIGVGLDAESGLLVTEISIAFAELGIAGPVDGRVLGVALGYNFLHPFSQTQWAPLPAEGTRGFMVPERYARLTLEAGTEQPANTRRVPVRNEPVAGKWQLPARPTVLRDGPSDGAVQYICTPIKPTVAWREADEAENRAMLAALTPEQLGRSCVQRGDTARLRRILDKARAGEPVTIAMIGGSFTSGEAHSDCYAMYFANWWKLQFPGSALTLANAAMGGTGSGYGAIRAERDLFPSRPDLVVVEFCINDPDTESTAETYEGLMRQILGKPWGPAVISFTVHGIRENMEHGDHEWHAKVIRHYNLPHVSARRAVAPEMLSGAMVLEDHQGSDKTHPNDAGHRFLARCLVHCIEAELQGIASGVLDAPTGSGALSEPLFGTRYDGGRVIMARELQVTAARGYAPYLRRWNGGLVGDELTFEVECGGLLALCYHRHFAPYMKAAEVRVDGGEPIVLDGWWKLRFGLGQHAEVARDLPYGRHVVSLRTVPSPSLAESPVDDYRGFSLLEVLVGIQR